MGRIGSTGIMKHIQKRKNELYIMIQGKKVHAMFTVLFNFPTLLDVIQNLSSK